MTWFVIQDRLCSRVINHPPRRSEHIIAACATSDDAFSELWKHNRECDRRRARRHGLLAALLVGLILFGNAIVEPAQTETVALPPCDGCTERQVVEYSPPTSARIDFPYIDGWKCTPVDGECLD